MRGTSNRSGPAPVPVALALAPATSADVPPQPDDGARQADDDAGGGVVQVGNVNQRPFSGHSARLQRTAKLSGDEFVPSHKAATLHAVRVAGAGKQRSGRTLRWQLCDCACRRRSRRGVLDRFSTDHSEPNGKLTVSARSHPAPQLLREYNIPLPFTSCVLNDIPSRFESTSPPRRFGLDRAPRDRNPRFRPPLCAGAYLRQWRLNGCWQSTFCGRGLSL